MVEIPNSGFAMEDSGFVALDIGNAAIASGDKDSNSTSSPRIIKSFSRKGSMRLGADNKKTEEDAAVFAVSGGAHGGIGLGGEKHAVSIHVACTEEPVTVSHVLAPTSVGAAGKYRRIGSRRSASPWLDPRRVLFVFASLSSMGTLILLYFTLSMSKTSSGDADAR